MNRVADKSKILCPFFYTILCFVFIFGLVWLEESQLTKELSNSQAVASEETIQAPDVHQKLSPTVPRLDILDGAGGASLEPKKELTSEEMIDSYVFDICSRYSDSENPVDPNVIRAQIFYESCYDSNAVGGDGAYLGLMQIAPKWNGDRMARLGVTDLMDPYSNILVGVDCLSELMQSHDLPLALMMYNGVSNAKERYKNGDLNEYTINVLNRAEKLASEGAMYG